MCFFGTLGATATAAKLVSTMLSHIVERCGVVQLRARTHPQNLRSMALLITLGSERIEAPDGQGRNDGADPADVEFIRNVRSDEWTSIQGR
jgi:hypothetical protein